MQPRVSTAVVTLAVTVMATGLLDTSTVVEARPMHAAIVSKYHRYLEEKEDVSAKLDAWLKVWGPKGPKNGYIPVTESRSSEDALEDQRQRFYLTQEQIYEAREANPMAEFGTDGPFTLMTMDEFKQFLTNAHINEAEKTEAPEIERPKTFSEKQDDTPSSEESRSRTRESKSEDSERKKAWAPATERPTVIAAMRHLRSSGKSQYAFNEGDYTTDGERGDQSTSDSYTQTTQPVYQGISGKSSSNVGNTNTNGGWNFGDISTGDSAHVGTLSVGSSAGNNNPTWKWWGSNGWGYNGNWGTGSNAGNTQWTQAPGSSNSQWTQPSGWTPPSGSSNSQWTPPPASPNTQWTPSPGYWGNQWPSGSSNNNQWTPPPNTDATPATQAPTTPPSTQAPTTPAPTAAPATPPPTKAPATDPPAPAPPTTPPPTKAPATDPPAPAPPATDPPATKAPKPAAPAPATKKKAVITESKPSDTTTAKDSDSDSVDWSKSGCVNPPGLQGQCGSCWAFASVGALEAAQCIANGDKKAATYSEQQLVSCDTKDFGCNGGAPLYAMEYLRDNGVCTESSYPYTSTNVEGGSAAACSKKCTPVKSGITKIVQLKAGDESALLRAVKKQPVIASVTSNNPAWKQYTGGVITSCDTATVDHAILVVGYDATTIKIKNSWGTDWGENGYVRVSRSPKNMGTCAVLTDMSYPQL
ncbi:unnamed protein product [Phytophthora fragariaefolia]|uniref:Unnamed protein product n=1 Tax=Phytophthora fragariaefolia TaxID=1490495 RepID=A0A9W6XDN7_9STRA|nr:unnamed protein product [Phytophthora fragariaefolia]